MKLLNRLFHGPAWLTFLFMGLAAGGFALCSLNLLYLFQANFNLIATYGAMAAFDGGILQFVEPRLGAIWRWPAMSCSRAASTASCSGFIRCGSIELGTSPRRPSAALGQITCETPDADKAYVGQANLLSGYGGATEAHRSC